MTEIVVLKLVLTPALIGVASLAGRRWGHAVSGWLVGLPLTSGPIAFFLALEHGAPFAAAAATGALAGAIAEAAFCLAYAAVAGRAWWPGSLAVACIAFAGVAAALQRAPLALAVLTPIVFVVLLLAMRALPRTTSDTSPPTPPRWDLPARMVIATAIVLAITESATILGPRLSGLLATFPAYAAILTVFAHRDGPRPAVQVLRGLLYGLCAFAGFFVVLGGLIERVGAAPAFVAASLTALAIQAGSLRLVTRRGS